MDVLCCYVDLYKIVMLGGCGSVDKTGFVDHDGVVGSSSNRSVLVHLRSTGAYNRRGAPLLTLVNHDLLIPTLHAAKCFVPTVHEDIFAMA